MKSQINSQISESLSIANALNQAMHQIMQSDPSVIMIGEDLIGENLATGAELGGVFGVSHGLAKAFGRNRVIETPISETAFVGMGIGAAMTGLKPIVEIMFCDFMAVCFDQIINQAAKIRALSGATPDKQIPMPLVIRTTIGAGDGSGAMHSQSLHGLLMQIPGLVIACPSNAGDAAGLLKAAVASEDVVILMEHKGLYETRFPVEASLPIVPLGKGTLVQKGHDITIIALSAMIPLAISAAEALKAEGYTMDVIDPRTVSPLDMDMILNSLHKTGRLIVVDEGAAIAGFADHVIAEVSSRAFDALKCAPRKITPPHCLVPYAPALEAAYLPTQANIIQTVKGMIHES